MLGLPVEWMATHGWVNMAGAETVIRVNDFSIEYREDGSEKQFFSDLSVLDVNTGEQLTRKTISVNKPLRWGGVTMYQTDWSLAALTLRAEGSPMQPADGSSFNLPMASLEGNPGQSRRACECAMRANTLQTYMMMARASFWSASYDCSMTCWLHRHCAVLQA